MKSKKIAAVILLSIGLLSCSQDKVVELPLTIQDGYGPFSMRFGGISPNSDNENNPWYKTYLKIPNYPEGLTDIKFGHIETNIYQTVYQNYLLGNITEDWYENLQNSWNWIPDTLNLSKKPVKTQIAFAYGEDAEGVLKMVVDVNNNLDLSDDELFTPLEIDFERADSLAQNYAFNVSFETFVHNKIVSVNAPLFIAYYSQMNVFVSNFSQYATTQYKGEQIAVSSSDFMNLSYENIGVALVPDNLKEGEKVKEENIYKKNEYIVIKGEIFKITGVNTNKNTLVLEKPDLSKEQLLSTQTGNKPYPFQGEDFTTKEVISLEILRGKYVFLDFWAESCGPCIQEFPFLKELYANTDREKFEIIGIAGHSSFNGVNRLIEQHGLTWPNIFDDTNKIVNSYGINSYPTSLLLNTEGIIIAKNLRGEKLQEKILSLIGE